MGPGVLLANWIDRLRGPQTFILVVRHHFPENAANAAEKAVGAAGCRDHGDTPFVTAAARTQMIKHLRSDGLALPLDVARIAICSKSADGTAPKRLLQDLQR